MIIVVFWIGFSLIPALIASNKGRSAGGFFLLSLLVSPLIGLLIALFASPDAKAIEKQQAAAGGMRKCPSCAEMVKAEAVKCRFCQTELTPVAVAAPEAPPIDPARMNPPNAKTGLIFMAVLIAVLVVAAILASMRTR
jgi:hypothetical protein